MAPVVHGLEADYAGKVDFVYLDSDDAATKPFRDQLQARGQPRFYLLDGQGQVVEKWSGSVDREDFVAAIDRLLSTAGG
jgi:thioredoxin-like negative regulator of GroEL